MSPTARHVARHGVKDGLWVLSPWSGKWRRVIKAEEPHVNSKRVIITPEEGCEFEVPWSARLERRGT